MAVAPLFVSDLDTLKARLRLTGVPPGRDAQKIIEDAVLTVRLNFYRAIADTRIDILLGYASTEDPRTASERLRSLAELTEVLWVRKELSETLPHAFMDGGNDLLERWNEEAPFRQSPDDLGDRLMKQINDNLDLLKGDESFGSETRIRGGLIGPDEPYRPGSSIF